MGNKYFTEYGYYGQPADAFEAVEEFSPGLVLVIAFHAISDTEVGIEMAGLFKEDTRIEISLAGMSYTDQLRIMQQCAVMAEQHIAFYKHDILEFDAEARAEYGRLA